MNLIVAIVLMVFLLMLGLKTYLVFTAVVTWMVFSTGITSNFFISAGYNTVNSITLLTIPMFILAGNLMEAGELGDALVNFVNKFIGWVKGSYSIITYVASAIFGAVTGSGMATLLCIGAIMAPRMNKARYPKGLTAATIACAAPLGMLIPPSGLMIIFAWMANQSVLACFLATLIPGILAITLLSFVNFLMLRNNRDIVSPPEVTVAEWKSDLWPITRYAIPALLMPIIILGGIYSGKFTASETASIAVPYAIIIGMLIYKSLKWNDVVDSFGKSATLTGASMVSMFCAAVMSKYFLLADLHNILTNFLMSISDNKYVILIMINILLLIIGMIMDNTSGMIICTPLLLPVIKAIGVHPIHFAAIIAVNLGLATITPPAAPYLYMSCKVVNTDVISILKPTMILLFFAWIPVLILTTFVPEIALWLPRILLGRL